MYQSLVIASFAYAGLCFVSGAVVVGIAWWGYVEVKKKMALIREWNEKLKPRPEPEPERETEDNLAYLETDFSHLL